LNRDVILILTANAARNFGYGILEVMFVLYLAEIGVDALRIGFLIAITLVGSAFLNLVFVLLADRIGRRLAMRVATLLLVGTGLVLIFSRNYFSYLLVALTGTLNFSSISTGGFVGLDQAILPQLTPPAIRNRIFGVYNTGALLARMLGALISGLPSLLHTMYGLDLVSGYRILLVLFVSLGFLSLILILALSEAVEMEHDKVKLPVKLFDLGRSRSIILRISALFGIDALTSGFAGNSLIVLMFYQRFGVGAEVMGPVYTVARLLQAASYQVAVRLADRFGLLNTMVFTHLPSQFLLIALPFATNLPLGIFILLARQGLSQMDVPTRQAYIAAVVHPEDRTAAAGVTNLTRNLAQSVSPSFTGYAFQNLMFNAPFLVAGVLGIFYDLALFVNFRGIKPTYEIENLKIK
jgi:MFS family permease